MFVHCTYPWWHEGHTQSQSHTPIFSPLSIIQFNKIDSIVPSKIVVLNLGYVDVYQVTPRYQHQIKTCQPDQTNNWKIMETIEEGKKKQKNMTKNNHDNIEHTYPKPLGSYWCYLPPLVFCLHYWSSLSFHCRPNRQNWFCPVLIWTHRPPPAIRMWCAQWEWYGYVTNNRSYDESRPNDFACLERQRYDRNTS